MKKPVTVWYNRGLSNTYDALTIIKAADKAGQFTLRASHTDPNAAALTAADAVSVEPSGLENGAYVDWCLEQCRAHSVGIFVPQRRREVIVAQRDAFAAEGVLLSVMAGPEVMGIVDRKHELYSDLAGTEVPIPRYTVFHSVAEFDAAVVALEAECGSLCVKPCVGVYGAGFRRLEREGCDFRRLLSGDNTGISFTAFRAALAGSAQDRAMMLMEYLPEVERSVDVLAHHGTLVRAVARAKSTGHQVLETEGPSLEIASFLTDKYGLDGIFNLQTKEKDGVPYLLEINSRMSGGLLYACLSGVAFPYWNLMLTAGFASPQDVPAAVAGCKVAPVQGCIITSRQDRSDPPSAANRL
jgi:hypothetical protein